MENDLKTEESARRIAATVRAVADGRRSPNIVVDGVRVVDRITFAGDVRCVHLTKEARNILADGGVTSWRNAA